jgi:DNA-binding CsgD family transcriptional regulator
MRNGIAMHASASDSTPFLDREAEIDRVLGTNDEHFEQAILITGRPGIGKTRLLEEVAARAGVRTALITTTAAESTWPLAGFSRLFAALDDPRAIEFSGRFTLRSTEPQQMFQAARDLLSVLRGLRLEPILLMIDDADLMDRESLMLLGFMAGRLAGTGIRLVGTARRVPSGEMFQAATRFELPALGPADSLALLRATCPPTADAGVLEIVCEQSGGVPAALIDVGRLLTLEQFEGGVAVPLPLPHTARVLEDSVARTGALGPRQRLMLQKISLQASANVDALTADADDAEVIDDLVNAGFVRVRDRAVGIADTLLRSSLYWGIDPKVRRVLHAELAQTAVDHAPEVAVWHASYTTAEDEDAARELFDAAAAFERSGRRSTAVEYAERAIAVAPTRNELLRHVLDLVDAFFRHGEVTLAQRYLMHAQLGEDRAAGAFVLAEIRAAVDYTATGVVPEHEIDTAVAVHGPRNRTGATRLLIDAAYWHTERRDFVSARRAIGRADVGPTSSAAEQMLRDALVALIDSYDRPQNLQVVDADTIALRLLLLAADTASMSEEYAQARRLYAVGLARLDDENTLWREAVWFRSVVNEIRAGTMKRAREAYVEWHRTQVAAPHLGARASRIQLRAWYALSTGEYETADTLFAAAIDRATVEGNMAVSAISSAILGTLALAQKRYEHARRLLDDADATSNAMPNPAIVRHLPDLALAEVLTGHRTAAERTLARLEAVEAQHPSRWIELSIPLVRAIVAPADTSLALFREAIATFRDDDSRYLLARTWEMLAGRQFERGEVDEAAHSHATARAIYRAAGASAWIGAAPPAAATSGVAPPSDNRSETAAVLDTLNEDERQVVDLVLKGLRNKEIAATLYISVRTVELRLTRVYRKAGARSRSHLVALLN